MLEKFIKLILSDIDPRQPAQGVEPTPEDQRSDLHDSPVVLRVGASGVKLARRQHLDSRKMA